MWDEQLANVAQKYTEKCTFGHNNFRVAQQSTYSIVGENIEVTTSSESNPEAAVKSWHNEVDNYHFDSNSCNGICWHYTQVCIAHYCVCVCVCTEYTIQL